MWRLTDPGQGPGVNLDVPGGDRPVGLTHYYDQSSSVGEQNPDCFVESSPKCPNRGSILPVIVLRDLLGREPLDNETLDLQINLAKTPVRTNRHVQSARRALVTHAG